MSVTWPGFRKDPETESEENHLNDSAMPAQEGSALPEPVIRTLQRHFVPGFVASFYYFLKYRCLISHRAVVQISDRISFGKGTVVKPFAVIQTVSKIEPSDS